MELETTRDPHAFVDDEERDPAASADVPRGKGSRVGWVTLGLAAALVSGVVLGATGRAPQSVPGPTVTMTVTPPTAEPVETRFGLATREQRAVVPVIEPGVQAVGQGAIPGTWVGVPFAADQICHWQRLRIDEDDRTIVVAEVLTNGRTVVTIRADDARFVSYGCRWTPEG